MQLLLGKFAEPVPSLRAQGPKAKLSACVLGIAVYLIPDIQLVCLEDCCGSSPATKRLFVLETAKKSEFVECLTHRRWESLQARGRKRPQNLGFYFSLFLVTVVLCSCTWLFCVVVNLVTCVNLGLLYIFMVALWNMADHYIFML